MAKSPLAGVCEKMARVVNSYCKPAWEARVCNVGPGKHTWYCRPPRALVPKYSIKDRDQVQACLDWADVIHCMANVGIRSPWFKGLNLRVLLKNKVWVFQWHGAQIWDFRAVWHDEDYPYVRFIHIGQGWIQTQREFFDEFVNNWNLTIVPNLITGDDPLHQPLPWEQRKNKTGFAPSQHRENAVNRKGIFETTNALRGTQYDLISKTSFDRCLKRKQKCRLGIDEVVTPMYHLSGLEFLAQGTPCFCSHTKQTIDVLQRAIGCSRFPFMNASPKDLGAKVRQYWAFSDEQRQQMGKSARGWFDEYYHPRQLIERHIDVYER